MSDTAIPYMVKPNPVTGIPNGKFAIWLWTYDTHSPYYDGPGPASFAREEPSPLGFTNTRYRKKPKRKSVSQFGRAM